MLSPEWFARVEIATMVRFKFLSHTCAFHRHVNSRDSHRAGIFILSEKKKLFTRICVAYSYFMLAFNETRSICIARYTLLSRSSVNWKYSMRLSMCEKQKSMLPCQTQFHVSTPILFRCIFLTASTYNSLSHILILATQYRICVRTKSIFQYQSSYYYILHWLCRSFTSCANANEMC